MLDVRTNILLDRQTHDLLTSIASSEKKSIGELIRSAIDAIYKKRDKEIIRKRTKAVQEIIALRKKMKPLKGISFRELINYGRYR